MKDTGKIVGCKLLRKKSGGRYYISNILNVSASILQIHLQVFVPLNLPLLLCLPFFDTEVSKVFFPKGIFDSSFTSNLLWTYNFVHENFSHL